jgi:hypothetical protein
MQYRPLCYNPSMSSYSLYLKHAPRWNAKTKLVPRAPTDPLHGDLVLTGHLYFKGKTFSLDGVQMSPRRAAWILLVGPLDEDQVVVPLRSCNDDNCIRPEHSDVITRQEHLSRQSHRDIRHKPKGDQNPQAKLTEEQIADLRLDSLILSRKELQVKYQVSLQQISRYLRGKRSESKEEREAQVGTVIKNNQQDPGGT